MVGLVAQRVLLRRPLFRLFGGSRTFQIKERMYGGIRIRTGALNQSLFVRQTKRCNNLIFGGRIIAISKAVRGLHLVSALAVAKLGLDYFQPGNFFCLSCSHGLLD